MSEELERLKEVAGAATREARWAEKEMEWAREKFDEALEEARQAWKCAHRMARKERVCPAMKGGDRRILEDYLSELMDKAAKVEKQMEEMEVGTEMEEFSAAWEKAWEAETVKIVTAIAKG